MIWLFPHPLPPLLSASCMSFSFFLCHRSSLLTGEGEGVGEELNHKTSRKPDPLHINHSLLSTSEDPVSMTFERLDRDRCSRLTDETGLSFPYLSSHYNYYYYLHLPFSLHSLSILIFKYLTFFGLSVFAAIKKVRSTAYTLHVLNFLIYMYTKYLGRL